MCGIAGFFSRSRVIEPGVLDRFTDSLSHRGPDGRGVWISPDSRAGLGHRRLSILDLSDAGRCPMQFLAPDGREFYITFNGEVFNFLELREELQAKGYAFHSHTDTEVIVAAYACWGADCLLRFNGMWALAIWDVREGSLFLSRDRFGIKPLNYYERDDSFYFASELKAFLALPDFNPRTNEEFARRALNNQSQSLEGNSDETLLHGVKKLLAGHWMKVSADGSRAIRRWWDTRDHIPEIPSSYEDQVSRFRELFLDANRVRMRSDVPVATSLSGGLDSSAVACALTAGAGGQSTSRIAPDWRRAFVACFPGTMLDEQAYADEVVKYAGLNVTHSVFQGEVDSGAVEESVWAIEDVLCGITSPVLLNYRAMRNAGSVVSIDGHGADEMMGGYPWYLDVSGRDLNSRLDNDFHRDLLPCILRNFDRCSMASGVEVRMPFMDWRLVSFCFGLAPDAKLGGGFTKRILRDAMKGMMPEDIRVRRSKIGFNAPVVDWFNAGCGGLLDRVLNHERWKGATLFDSKKVGDALNVKLSSRSFVHADWVEVMNYWTYINLVVWEILFIDQKGLKK